MTRVDNSSPLESATTHNGILASDMEFTRYDKIITEHLCRNPCVTKAILPLSLSCKSSAKPSGTERFKVTIGKETISSLWNQLMLFWVQINTFFLLTLEHPC